MTQPLGDGSPLLEEHLPLLLKREVRLSEEAESCFNWNLITSSSLRKRKSKIWSKNTQNSSTSKSNCKLKRPLKRKFLTMKKSPKRKKVKTLKSKTRVRRNQKKKRKKKLKKYTPNSKCKTNRNQSGCANLKLWLRRNTLPSINRYPTTGKTIWPWSNSPLRVNSSSRQSSSYPKELPLTSSKPRRKKITLNSTSEESSLWTTARIWSLTALASLRESLILKIFLSTFPENSYNKTRSSRSSKKILSKKFWSCSVKSKRMLKITKNSTNNSQRISNWVSMRTRPTVLNYPNSSVTTPVNLETSKSPWKTMWVAWKKDKRIFTSSLESPNKLLPTPLSSSLWKRKESKSSIWSTQLMSTSSNSWKSTMEKNLKTVLRKVWNWKKTKIKKRNSKNKKLNMKDFANQLKKSLETKLKKSFFQTELKTHLVFWSPVNTDGVQIWKESWRLKPSEILPCNHIWHRRRQWNWTPNTRS